MGHRAGGVGQVVRSVPPDNQDFGVPVFGGDRLVHLIDEDLVLKGGEVQLDGVRDEDFHGNSSAQGDVASNLRLPLCRSRRLAPASSLAM
ncbi:hypothetical protein D3C85_1775470 [compost metagenome]